MNSLSGHICDVEVNGSLSLVTVKVREGLMLKSIIIDTPETAPYLKNGTHVNLLFKETEVVIGTGENHRISLQNQIRGHIKLIEEGKLISKVSVNTEVGQIISIISTQSVRQLNLKEHSEVTVMVKLNEIMLSQ